MKQPPGFDRYIQEIQEFITPSFGSIQPRWFYSEKRVLEVYLRRRPRSINQESGLCVDIANIVVKDNWQNQGHGTRLIETIYQVNPHQFTYVEIVHNHNLSRYLEKNGWTVDLSQPDLCYYKINPHINRENYAVGIAN